MRIIYDEVIEEYRLKLNDVTIYFDKINIEKNIKTLDNNNAVFLYKKDNIISMLTYKKAEDFIKEFEKMKRQK